MNTTVQDLQTWQAETGQPLPMPAEDIEAFESLGLGVDLDTGEVFPDITPDTRVTSILTTEQDIDAAVIEIRAALARLEQRPTNDNPFLRGFKSGAESAYRDTLRLLGQGFDGEGRGDGQ